MKIPLSDEIDAFLREFKKCWDGTVIPRQDPRNEDTITVLGITPRHRADEINKLKFADYAKGPVDDHDGSGNKWWIFGRRVKGYEVYIKIQIRTNKMGRKKGRCISFHFPDPNKPAMTYPHKKKG